MSNVILGNTYILDTQSGNTALPWPNKVNVVAIVARFTNQTGRAVFTGADTSQVILELLNPNSSNTTVGAYLGGVPFTEMKMPTLTVGSAWIYFQ